MDADNAKSAAASSMRRRQEEHIARINQQQIKSSPEAPLTVKDLKSENTDKTKGAAASMRQEERCQN